MQVAPSGGQISINFTEFLFCQLSFLKIAYGTAASDPQIKLEKATVNL